jgi:NCS1 family nucleobase:cation symporter-1
VLALPPGADTMDAVKLATGPLGLPMLVFFLLSADRCMPT